MGETSVDLAMVVRFTNHTLFRDLRVFGSRNDDIQNYVNSEWLADWFDLFL